MSTTQSKQHSRHATMFGLARHARWYEYTSGRLARRLYRRVTADVVGAGLPAGARILDVGTGPGLLPLELAAACPQARIEGIDLAPEMIDRARHNAARKGLTQNVTFTVADVADLPFADASVDLIVSTVSQHHWGDPAAALRELRRVLRPGGQAWIYDVRRALPRAREAARELDGVTVTYQVPLPGSSRFSLVGRLVLHR